MCYESRQIILLQENGIYRPNMADSLKNGYKAEGGQYLSSV